MLSESRRLNAEVLAAAGQLKPVTIETLLARSDLEAGIVALLRGWPGTGLTRNGTAMGVKELMITALPPLAVRMQGRRRRANFALARRPTGKVRLSGKSILFPVTLRRYRSQRLACCVLCGDHPSRLARERVR